MQERVAAAPPPKAQAHPQSLRQKDCIIELAAASLPNLESGIQRMPTEGANGRKAGKSQVQGQRV